MRKTLSVIAISAAMLAGGAPVAHAGTTPPTPVPAECQPYYDSAANSELESAQRLVQISDLQRQVESLRATVTRKDAVIARLRHRLHHQG